MVEKNINIPFPLFIRLVEFLEYWDVPEYTSHFRQDFEYILSELQKKKRKMKLRETYAKIICAEDDDTRHDARICYLQQRRESRGHF
jgi:hypothetical protein